jgi:hypothetical protein
MGGLIVTFTGDADTYLIRGAIWELGASSYRAYVHVVPPGFDSRSVPFVVSVNGPTLRKALDKAIARVMTTTGMLVQNIQVHAAPRNSEAPDGSRPIPHPLGVAQTARFAS